MPMPRHEILRAIEDRLRYRWPKHFERENAAPLCVVGIKQLDNADYGTPVITMVEDMPTKDLAALLIGIASKLLEESEKK